MGIINLGSLLGSFLTSYLGAKPTQGASGLGEAASYDVPKSISFGDRLGQGFTGMGKDLFNNTKLGPFKLGNITEFQKLMDAYKNKSGNSSYFKLEDLVKLFTSTSRT